LLGHNIPKGLNGITQYEVLENTVHQISKPRKSEVMLAQKCRLIFKSWGVQGICWYNLVMDQQLLSHFFPEGLLDWFDISGFEQGQDGSIHSFY